MGWVSQPQALDIRVCKIMSEARHLWWRWRHFFPEIYIEFDFDAILYSICVVFQLTLRWPGPQIFSHVSKGMKVICRKIFKILIIVIIASYTILLFFIKKKNFKFLLMIRIIIPWRRMLVWGGIAAVAQLVPVNSWIILNNSVGKCVHLSFC